MSNQGGVTIGEYYIQTARKYSPKPTQFMPNEMYNNDPMLTIYVMDNISSSLWW